MTEFIRANKITAQFEGEGMMVATFYRTHNKLGQIHSSEVQGFVAPEGEDVTPAMKLEAFKEFIKANANVFGYVYDPVDRRPESAKYPSSYLPETLVETANTILAEKLSEVSESIQNHINKLVENGHMAVGAAFNFSIGTGSVNVQECYKSGNLKYADVTFPVTLDVAGLSTVIEVKIILVSGQIKKPRDFGPYVFTMTGIKGALVEAGLIPKVEKEKPAEEDAPTDVPAEAQA